VVEYVTDLTVLMSALEVNAAVKFADGIWYKYYNDILLQEGRGHKPAVTGFSFGVKVNF
jgi:hypothetical protein